jgi:hypothetical protein
MSQDKINLAITHESTPRNTAVLSPMPKYHQVMETKAQSTSKKSCQDFDLDKKVKAKPAKSKDLDKEIKTSEQKSTPNYSSEVIDD